MNRTEFLSELENSLEGKLPKEDISEILADYNDIFEGGIYEGRPEEAITSELGSPAKIARKILEDAPVVNRENQGSLKNRAYIGDTKNLAPMSKRFAAFFIDTIIGAIILLALLTAAYLPFSTKQMVTFKEVNSGDGYEARLFKDKNGATTKVEILDKNGKYLFKGTKEEFPKFLDKTNIKYPDDFKERTHVITYKRALLNKTIFIIALLSLGFGNLFNFFITWKFKGYTIGKKLFKIRVQKLDGSKLSFMDSLFRELIIKSIANTVLGGLINLGSFIWACITNEQNTIHDRAVKTKVISVKG